MGATRQQAEHVLGADDREREALRVAVKRREKDRAARAQQRRARRDDDGRLGHVLEHLEAGDDVEAGGPLACELLDVDAAIVHRDAAIGGVLARGVEAGLREVDPEHRGSASGERLAQQAAAAADVEHARARQAERARRCSPCAGR